MKLGSECVFMINQLLDVLHLKEDYYSPNETVVHF